MMPAYRIYFNLYVRYFIIFEFNGGFFWCIISRITTTGQRIVSIAQRPTVISLKKHVQKSVEFVLRKRKSDADHFYIQFFSFMLRATLDMRMEKSVHLRVKLR